MLVGTLDRMFGRAEALSATEVQTRMRGQPSPQTSALPSNRMSRTALSTTWHKPRVSDHTPCGRSRKAAFCCHQHAQRSGTQSRQLPGAAYLARGCVWRVGSARDLFWLARTVALVPRPHIPLQGSICRGPDHCVSRTFRSQATETGPRARCTGRAERGLGGAILSGCFHRFYWTDRNRCSLQCQH